MKVNPFVILTFLSLAIFLILNSKTSLQEMNSNKKPRIISFAQRKFPNELAQKNEILNRENKFNKEDLQNEFWNYIYNIINNIFVSFFFEISDKVF